MKILFGYCDLKSFFGDNSVKLGLGWYRHSKDHKWIGFTVEFYLLFWYVHVDYISNYEAYKKRMSFRASSYLNKKISQKKKND